MEKEIDDKENKRTWLEWIVTIISTIIVFITVGILIYQMVVVEPAPPEIVVDFGKTEAKEGYYAVPVIIGNLGHDTAKKVRVEFTLENGRGTETSFLEYDYVPGKSEVKGWIGFTVNPEGKTIKHHILGYLAP